MIGLFLLNLWNLATSYITSLVTLGIIPMFHTALCQTVRSGTRGPASCFQNKVSLLRQRRGKGKWLARFKHGQTTQRSTSIGWKMTDNHLATLTPTAP